MPYNSDIFDLQKDNSSDFIEIRGLIEKLIERGTITITDKDDIIFGRIPIPEDKPREILE